MPISFKYHGGYLGVLGGCAGLGCVALRVVVPRPYLLVSLRGKRYKAILRFSCAGSSGGEDRLQYWPLALPGLRLKSEYINKPSPVFLDLCFVSILRDLTQTQQPNSYNTSSLSRQHKVSSEFCAYNH
jgi:hypothetical protein